MERVTPDNITSLQPGEVFVFGSNESGIHGAGAALLATNEFGAKLGQGFGFSVQSFAIPTTNWQIRTLDKERIDFYVDRFIEYAELHPELTFYVTEIGCGLAGYEPKDIAPMFYWAKQLKNVYLPARFWLHFETEYEEQERQ